MQTSVSRIWILQTSLSKTTFLTGATTLDKIHLLAKSDFSHAENAVAMYEFSIVSPQQPSQTAWNKGHRFRMIDYIGED